MRESAQLLDADVKGDPGAQGRLLEDHGQGLATAAQPLIDRSGIEP
jgi:hypothetical protein